MILYFIKKSLKYIVWQIYNKVTELCTRKEERKELSVEEKGHYRGVIADITIRSIFMNKNKQASNVSEINDLKTMYLIQYLCQEMIVLKIC